MRSILVSEAVWEVIANRGKFGESEDDVLRRIFDLPAATAVRPTNVPSSGSRRQAGGGPRRSFATDRLSSYISGNELRLEFASGATKSWSLPAKGDKVALRSVRDKATAFAEEHGATLGQVNAVRKTLTDAGFHLNK